MKKIFWLFSLIALVPFQAVSQNLIRNPGFESGISGWSFWSNEGLGGITAVGDTVFSGTKALRIQYPGEKDWAVKTGKIPVESGSQYQLSCRALPISVSSTAYCSLTLYDSGQNVVDWVFGRITLGNASNEYQLCQNRIIIPEGVKYVQPRLEGWGACRLFADDLVLEKVIDLGLTGDFSIENQFTKVDLHLPSLSFDLTDKRIARVYRSVATQFVKADSVDVSQSGIIRVFGLLLQGEKPPVMLEFSLENSALKILLKADSGITLTGDIRYPGVIPSKADEFFIVPRATGIMFPVTQSSPFGDFATYAWKGTMPFVGVTNLKQGYMVVSDDSWDASFRFDRPAGQSYFSVQLNQKASKGKFESNRTAYVVPVTDGYVGMCDWYRQHAEKLGIVKTLAQKLEANENIDKLLGAVDFWPLSLNLNVTFLRTVKLLGIDKAVWNLTGGWGIRNFSTLVDSINAMGYLSGRYDIFTDVWPENTWGYRSEGYPQDVIVDAAGNLKKGWLAYQNGQPFQGYYTCSATHKDYAQNYVGRDLAINKYNSRFIDVELSSALEECYSGLHPVTRKGDAEARSELLSYIHNNLGLVTGVEEAHDFAFQHVDYSEGTMTIVPAANAGYDWSQPLDPTDKTYEQQNISPAMRVPLHGLVYHDVHIPTWYTGDGVSKVPAYWDDKDLWNILYGSMPLFMPPSLSYWNTNLERFVTSYHLVSAVTRNVGLAKMIRHEFLSEDRFVQKTRFDNNWEVVVNFDSTARDWEGIKLAPKGFFASGGAKDQVFRIEENGLIKAGAVSGERLFFNPGGNEQSWNGIRTSQSVFIQKYPDFLLLSFVGRPDHLDLKVAELPFEVGEITKVTEYSSGKMVSLTDAGDGWKRLSRPADKLYYKLFFSGGTGAIELKENPFRIFPNPAGHCLTVLGPAQSAGVVSVCNLQGQELQRQPFEGGKAQIDLGLLNSGLYLVNALQDGSRFVGKFVKQ